MTADSKPNFYVSPYWLKSLSCRAEEATDVENDCAPTFQVPTTTLDPTPLRLDNIQIVDEVPITENPWHSDVSIFDALKPLLQVPIENCRGERSNAHVVDDSQVDSTDDQTSCGEGVDARSEQWHEKFQALVRFFQKHGHAQVPHTSDDDPSLVQWVKRQRHQHKLKKGGHRSALTDEREALLEQLGFVWDSHASTWEERLAELREFAEEHGHCMVPIKFPENQQLATWVKCQRRQFKLFCNGRRSNITTKRIRMLASIGFVFNPRNLKSGVEVTEESIKAWGHRVTQSRY